MRLALPASELECWDQPAGAVQQHLHRGVVSAGPGPTAGAAHNLERPRRHPGRRRRPPPCPLGSNLEVRSNVYR